MDKDVATILAFTASLTTYCREQRAWWAYVLKDNTKVINILVWKMPRTEETSSPEGHKKSDKNWVIPTFNQ